MSTGLKVLVSAERALNYLISPMVEVRVGVGAAAKSFYIHKDLLTSRSHFFRKALEETDVKKHVDHDDEATMVTEECEFLSAVSESGDEEEGVIALSDSEYEETENDIATPENKKREEEDESLPETKHASVFLPNEYPEIVASYTQLLYQGVLPFYTTIATSLKDEDVHHKEVVKATNREWNILAQLYVFANKMQDITSKRQLITAFVEASTRIRADGHIYIPTTAPITTVFEGTNEGDPLRELLVDLYAVHGHQGWTKNPTQVEFFSKDFLYQCFYAMLTFRPALMQGAEKLSNVAYYADQLEEHQKTAQSEKRDA